MFSKQLELPEPFVELLGHFVFYGFVELFQRIVLYCFPLRLDLLNALVLRPTDLLLAFEDSIR